MTWTFFECRTLKQLRYIEHTQTLEMKYADGSYALSSGITNARYKELIATSPEDRDIFLMNFIEPFIVSRRRPPGLSTTAWKMIALAVLVAGSLWFLFWITDHITSMPKSAR